MASRRSRTRPRRTRCEPSPFKIQASERNPPLPNPALPRRFSHLACCESWLGDCIRFCMTSPSSQPGGYQPRLVFWELTTGCNLRCIHCRASATDLMSPEDLSTRECLRIVDEIAAYSPLILVLSGGEPLWRRDVFEISKHAVRKGLRVALATNGTLVDEAMAERIKDAGIVRVSISLDGSDRTTHDSFRGHDGAFDAAIRGLKCLQDLGISTQINTTVSKHNVHQLPEMVELAKKLKVDAFHLFLLVPVGCGLTIAEDQSVSAEDAERILNWFCRGEAGGRTGPRVDAAPARARAPGWTPALADRSEPDDPRVPRRQRRLLHQPQRLHSALRLPPAGGGKPAATVVQGCMGEFGALRRSSQPRQPGRQVRVLRVQAGLHGLPGESFWRLRRLPPGGAVLPV